jgi:hypothetical protein
MMAAQRENLFYATRHTRRTGLEATAVPAKSFGSEFESVRKVAFPANSTDHLQLESRVAPSDAATAASLSSNPVGGFASVIDNTSS